MKEKELRLALVCYGGVSLAVYMHGVADEILKLTRASKVFHEKKPTVDKARNTYEAHTPNVDYETDTEALYFELIEALSPKIKLRVIVDTISGASAGGINGIFLARALAHDLSLSPQRKMWIELADVLKLMDDQTIAKRWSKFYLYPVLLVLGWKRMRKYFPSKEMRRKVSIFLRSRWLEPPFSGETMLGWMLDAAAAQGKATVSDKTAPKPEVKSLMPPGQRLDLMVSLTNFHGTQQAIAMNDPEFVSELEHRTTLRFQYFHRGNDAVESDFSDDNIPGLAFAARATSSFPGAFPPVSLNDLLQSLERRKQEWPAKDIFMERNISQFHNHGAVPEDIHFIDGSVVNNKPFGALIAALPEHPAHREVDRRIIYIDPNPEKLDSQEGVDAPGFFHTIFDAVVQIPSNEPIRDELNKVSAHNKRARRLQKVTNRLKADIAPFLENLVTLDSIQYISTALLVSWREKVNTEAVTKAGYAYSSYLYLKLYYLLDSVTHHLSQSIALDNTQTEESIRASVLVWADENKIWSSDQDNLAQYDMLAIVRILRNLDIDFRVRRLRFMIKYINEAYQSLDSVFSDSDDIQHLNALKKLAYQYVHIFKSCWKDKSLENQEVCFSDNEAINQVVVTLSQQWNLEENDLKFDEAFSAIIKKMVHENVKLEIIRSYIGFAFHDVLTLPLLQTTDLTEIDTISVNRISPDDRSSIPWPKGESMIQGNKFGNFGAFFQRSARENDHIWGRLHASERLVDFIIDSADASNLPDDFDLYNFKKRLFQTILNAEKPHIKAGKAEFDRIQSVINSMENSD